MAEIDDLRLNDENFAPSKGQKAIPTYIDKYNDLLDYLSDVPTGATQGGADVAAGSVWQTTDHATLPDNILMMGI